MSDFKATLAQKRIKYVTRVTPTQPTTLLEGLVNF